MFTYENLLIEQIGDVQKVIINREKTYNSLSTSTKLELVEALTNADNNPEVKAIILTGAGEKSFCSGQDLSESQDLDEEAAENWIEEFDVLYRAIKKIKKPIVAAVNGFATGSGLQLALLCDIRVSADTAKYGMTEVNVGLPCVIGSTMFWEVMGKSRTVDLILTGRLLDAVEAERYGLITRIVPLNDLEEASLKLAEELAEKPPTAIIINKRRFNQLSELEFNRCMSYAIEAHTIGYASGEPQEQMRQFFEKRVKKN
ncbi:enoyl-CoA hydratase/isomerase family protein [Ureibacillus sp. NPDC094379]